MSVVAQEMPGTKQLREEIISEGPLNELNEQGSLRRKSVGNTKSAGVHECRSLGV